MARMRCSAPSTVRAWAAGGAARERRRPQRTAERAQVRAPRTLRPIRRAAEAAPSPAPRRGTARRRASRRRRRARRFQSCRSGVRSSATAGHLEHAQKVQRDRGRSSSSTRIVRGSCSWNAQPASAPAGSDREQRRAERTRPDDRARRIAERIATCRALVTSALRQMQRFQREDREDAGHQVEQQSAQHRAEDRPEHRLRARVADCLAALRDVAADG